MSCTCRSSGVNFSVRIEMMRFCFASGVDRSSERTGMDVPNARTYRGACAARSARIVREGRAKSIVSSGKR